MRRIQLLAGVMTAVCGGLSAQAARADQPVAQPAEVQEVVVTANRREQPLQKVAGSVTAIPQAEIERRGFDDFSGIAQATPGLTMTEAVRNRAVFNIRGVSTTVIGANTQDPVAVYINDTPVIDTFGAAVTPDLHLFDVQRVEVLRGPQGTLFGSGSLGGTVRIITNAPDTQAFAAEGRVDLAGTSGGGPRQRYDAMVNVPLVADALALRIVGYDREDDGWVRNLMLGTRNSSHDWGGRIALLAKPTDNLSIKAEVLHQDSEPRDSESWNPALGEFKRASPVAEGRPSRLDSYNLSVDYDLAGLVRLTNSTTYQQSRTAVNVDLGPLLGSGPDFIGHFDPWTSRFLVQEVRLVSEGERRLRWVAGVFYINRRTSNPSYLIDAPGLNALFGGLLGGDTFINSAISTRSSELAGYGDATYELLPGLKLEGGLRLFHTTSAYDEQRTALDLLTFSYDHARITNAGADSNSTWRAGASYQIDPNRMVYLNVAKGYRVGQVNPNNGPSLIDPSDYVIPTAYGPDSTVNYEVGAKTRWFDGALTMNAALYYISWSNIQIDGARISDLLSFTANAGHATSKGAEIEFTARPATGLTLYGTVTLQDAHIDSVPSNIIVPAARGDVLPGLAHLKATAGGEFRWSLAQRLQAYVRLDGQYTSASPNTFSNGGASPFYAVDEAHENLSAAFGVSAPWGEVALYGENLTDNRAVIVKDLASPNPYTSLRPLTVGVRLTVRH